MNETRHELFKRIVAPLGMPAMPDRLQWFDHLSKVSDWFRVTISDETAYGRVVLDVARIEIPKALRNQGYGTTILWGLCTIADCQRWLMTTDSDTSLGATSKGRLERFYRRFGFVPNRGRTKRFDFPRCDMYRLPLGG